MASPLIQINKEILDFRTKLIQIVPQLTFNQYQTLQKIHYYYNSKYQSGDTDDEGDKKYFFNIVKNPCMVTTKAIDLDTKNIKLLTVGGGNALKTWFMERDLKFWMRDKQFGKILNRLFKELPIFGTVVMKVVDGTPYFVDLRNFIVEQSADTLEEMNFKTEIHNYTPATFRKVAKGMKWKQADIDSVIEQFHKMQDISHIRLYERYGEIAEEDNSGKKTYKYKRIFIADVGLDVYDQAGNLEVQHPGVTLSSEDWQDDPYWEFHIKKTPGRWLGIGVVEELFEPQIRQNEIANLQSKGSYWAALRLFQTRDGAINKNLLTDSRNGEVLNVDSEITQIDMSDRNLAFFNEEYQKWVSNAQNLTFSFGIVEGQGVAGGRSGNASVIASTMSNQYFGLIQENIALDLKEMIFDVIIPEFQKANTSAHTLRLVGQDLDTYIGMITNEMVLKEVIRVASSGDSFPTNQDKDAITIAIQESIKQNKEHLLPIPKDFYKDVKYDVDIDITQEGVDVQQRYATMFAILQAITADPTMTVDPVKKKILFQLAEDGGVNPNDLFGSEPVKIQDVMGANPNEVPQTANSLVPGRAGGGVSRPIFGASIPGKATKTL